MIGVVIVCYKSADVIFECLSSLVSAEDAPECIVIVDNASPDGTADTIAEWARTSLPDPSRAFIDILPSVPTDPAAAALSGSRRLVLIRSAINGGYAAGVNIGLSFLKAIDEISLFWVLNPDTTVPSGVSNAYRAAAAGGAELMGCRIVFVEPPHLIQSDGGTVSRVCGVCSNINRGQPSTVSQPPSDRLDFISGANLVVTRRVLVEVGPMCEDYFLYYEEVDWVWQARRRGFSLTLIADVVVHHHGGTVIGSGTLNRRQSPVSAFFNSRNRLRFVRRWMPVSLPAAFAFNMAKAVQLAINGQRDAAWAMVCATCGMHPPPQVSAVIAPEARARAFGRPQSATSTAHGRA